MPHPPLPMGTVPQNQQLQQPIMPIHGHVNSQVNVPSMPSTHGHIRGQPVGPVHGYNQAPLLPQQPPLPPQQLPPHHSFARPPPHHVGPPPQRLDHHLPPQPDFLPNPQGMAGQNRPGPRPIMHPQNAMPYSNSAGSQMHPQRFHPRGQGPPNTPHGHYFPSEPIIGQSPRSGGYPVPQSYSGPHQMPPQGDGRRMQPPAEGEMWMPPPGDGGRRMSFSREGGMGMPPPGEDGRRMPPPGEGGKWHPPGEGGMRMPPPGEREMRMPPPGQGGMRMPHPGEGGMRMPPPGREMRMPPPGEGGMRMPPPGGDLRMPPPGEGGIWMPPSGEGGIRMPPPGEESMRMSSSGKDDRKVAPHGGDKKVEPQDTLSADQLSSNAQVTPLMSKEFTVEGNTTDSPGTSFDLNLKPLIGEAIAHPPPAVDTPCISTDQVKFKEQEEEDKHGDDDMSLDEAEEDEGPPRMTTFTEQDRRLVSPAKRESPQKGTVPYNRNQPTGV